MVDPTNVSPPEDANADENLLLKKQQNEANALPADAAPIPAPPPLPGAGTPATGASAAPTTANDATPSVPLPPPGYGGTGKYGGMSLADAVQAKYRDDQAQQAATGVPIGEQDYSMAGMQDAGAWGMSDADRQANASRATSIASDPSSSPAMKELASMSGFATPEFDRSLNDGMHTSLAQKVAALRGTPGVGASASPAGSTAAPTGSAGIAGSGAPSGGSMAATPILSPRAALGAPAGGATDGRTPSSGLGTTLSPTPLSSAAPIGSTAAAPYTDANVQIGSTVLPNADPRLQNTQSMVDRSAQALGSIDRTKIAQDMFDQFAESTDPAYKLAMRRDAQMQAGMGRAGSGLARTSFGDLALQRGRDLDLAKRGFMSDALKGKIDDQFRQTDALAGLEGQQFGEGASNRSELRGERGYQGSLEEQSFQRALQQWLLERQGQQDTFNRGVTLSQLGESGNPAGYYGDMAGQFGFDPSLILALSGSLGQQNTGGTTGGNSGDYGGLTIPKFPGSTPPIVSPAPDPLYPAGQLPG